MKIEKVIFPPIGDERGNLVAIEENKDIPFLIERVYYVYDTLSDVVRGKHSHRDLEQILICVHGTCKILLDNGTEREIVVLDQPNEGIYIGPNTWREMYDFSEGAVLLVLASRKYDESDYIRNYDDFLEYIGIKK